MSESTIYKKIATVMSLVQRVPKTGYNSFHKYNYATESDLTESIRGILTEAGLAFFSSVIHQEREGEFTKAAVEFTIADVDTGEVLKSTYWGEGQDKGDKGLYKAYTGATKYFLMKTFLIPTGDDPEADTSVDERNHSKPATKPSSKPQKPPAANVTDINKTLTGTANKAQLKAVEGAIQNKGLSASDMAVVLQKFGVTKVEELQAGDVGNAVKEIMNFKVAK